MYGNVFIYQYQDYIWQKSIIIFLVGVVGVLIHSNRFLILLMCIEVIFLGLAIMFVTVSKFWAFHGGDSMAGILMVFLILAITASESAIGLGLIVRSFRVTGSSDLEELNELVK